MTVTDVQNRADLLCLALEADGPRVCEEFARKATDGEHGYDQLEPDEKKEIDGAVSVAVQTPAKVKAGIAAKAKLDKMYYDELRAAGFNEMAALTIAAGPGTGCLFVG